MQTKKVILLIGFLIPIFVFLGIILQAEYQNKYSPEVELAIHPYDPRDLLRGYYLTYTIDYGVKPCADSNKQSTGYICLNPRTFSETKPDNCELFIKGTCSYGNFTAGVERFYASEFTAKQLEQEIKQNPMSVVLSVAKDGNAQVKYLLVNGKRWSPK